jgi:hypothetical protein
MNNKILRFCLVILLFTPVSHSSNRVAFIQLVRFHRHVTGNCLIFKFLKQRGFAALPRTKI